MFYRENGQFKTSYQADQQIFPVAQDRWAIVALLAFAFVGVPLLADEYLLRAILIPFLILALAALGVNILVGYCGQISMGSGAFMAVGAYMAYNCFVRIDGMPLLVALLAGGFLPRSWAWCSACPACASRACTWPWRRSRRSFSATGLFAHPMVHRQQPLGLGVGGQPANLRLAHRHAAAKVPFLPGPARAVRAARKNLVRGAIGREWMAIRDMDVAAAVIGIRPMYAKLSAFAVSSFIIGVAGALWAFVHLGSWEPAAFSVERSFQLLFMVIIGGLGSIMGSFFGAAFIVVLPIFLSRFLPVLGALFGAEVSTALLAHTESMVFGVLIVWFLIVEPHGLAKLWSIGRQKMRLWPFPH